MSTLRLKSHRILRTLERPSICGYRDVYSGLLKRNASISTPQRFLALNGRQRLPQTNSSFKPIGNHWHPLQRFTLPSAPSGCRYYSKPLNIRYTRFAPGAGGKRRTPTLVVILVSGIVSYYLLHLERVPETGRIRFMDISSRYEAELANVTHAELLKEFQHQILPVNHPITRHVRRVVTSILEANDLGTLSSGQDASLAFQKPQPNVLWEADDTERRKQVEMNPEKQWNLLVVNDEKMVNAMASFNNIIVFTGILPICRDENGLAAVLGHEIGHVVARHPSERASVSKFLIAGVYVLCYIGLPLTAATAVVRFLLDLPNSRKQELEADRIGLKLSSRACFEPRAAVEMHHRLDMIEKKHGRINVSFLYTHPTGEQRVQLLTELLPEAYRVQEESPYCSGVTKTLRTSEEQ